MERLAEYFKVLSEPNRLTVLEVLKEGELNVTAVVEKTGRSQALVSKHLKLLTIAGLVKRKPKGSFQAHHSGSEIDPFCSTTAIRCNQCKSLMNQSCSGSDINEFVRALDNGERIFRMLHLEALDGVNLNLRECDLRGSRFKEARLGQANLSNAVVHGCCFQQALLWGADLSGIQATKTAWQEADLSGSRMQGANFSDALMHRCCFRGVIAAKSKWNETKLVEADFRSGLD